MIASIVIWALGYYPDHDAYETVAEQQENSYIGRIGKAMEPVIEPLGFDWKLGIGILSGLVIPKLMNVRGDQVCAALTASAPMLIAGLGMLLLPHLMPVWAFVGGCAQGASLVVALALIALRGHDSAETVVLSGVAQSFGYLIASLGPLMFGVLVQTTGGHHVPLMVFTFVAFLQCVVAVVVGKPSKM